MNYASQLDLDTAIRVAVLPILQSRLSDTLELHARVKQAHWNARDASFISLHELFDRIAEDIDSAADDIAERLVTLGEFADGRTTRTVQDNSLPDLSLGSGTIRISRSCLGSACRNPSPRGVRAIALAVRPSFG